MAVSWREGRQDSTILAVIGGAFVAAPIAAVTATDLQAHDFSRIVQIVLCTAACLVAAVVVGLHGASGRPLRRGWSTWAVAAAVACASAAVVSADNLSMVSLESCLCLSLVVLAGLIAWATQERAQLEAAFWIPVIAGGVLSFVIGVRYLAALGSEASLLREHLLPGFSNYRFFNHVQCVTIPLMAIFALQSHRALRVRRFGFVVLVLDFCWLAFTGGRATMLALALGAICAAVIYRSKSLPWLRVCAISALAGAGLYWTLFAWIPGLLGVSGDFTALDTVERTVAETGETRRLLWNLALKYVAESPWFGIGPMHFAHRVNLEAAHPHNIYLQIAAEWGVPMLILSLALAAMGIRRLVRATQRSESQHEATIGIGLTVACVSVAVDGFFSGNFVMPNSQLWIAFALGLAVAYVIRIERRHMEPNTTTATGRIIDLRWPLVIVIVLSQIALWLGVWPEILDVPAHVDRVRAEVVHNVRDNPRFWSHGWFK